MRERILAVIEKNSRISTATSTHSSIAATTNRIFLVRIFPMASFVFSSRAQVFLFLPQAYLALLQIGFEQAYVLFDAP